ncbi:MAG: TRAP transporter large permease subunit, partial [Microbacterium gubbeenense]
GFVTITEVAIIAAFYVLVLGLIYGTLRPRALYGILREGAVFSSTIMMLFASVGGFTFIIAVQRVGDQIADLVASAQLAPVVFLLLTMVFFLLIGMVLDAVPAILIFLPILLPVAEELGIDPIHFGVVAVVNLMIGLLTPPVGALLFVMTKIGRVRFGALVREVLPFLTALLCALTITTFVPAVVTFIPRLFFGN